MQNAIPAETLRNWLYDGQELALLDVREVGQIALGHILFSAPLPYSVFDMRLPVLVPNHGVRMVLCDDGTGVAQKAARRAKAMGYTNVWWLQGGVAAWAGRGHTLYQGVNVPSKAFGELVEHVSGTPRLKASEVAAMQAESLDMVVVDGRPLEEFAKMSIPGAVCCPNGELGLRISEIAPNPRTRVVINCAGRTRSIIGAQTLIDLGIPNPVAALENGTQGWTLDGLELERGAAGALPDMPAESGARRRAAEAVAAQFGVTHRSPSEIGDWLKDPNCTTYLLDVRTDDERASDPAARAQSMARHGVLHAPGGQLVQATDQWIGTRNARLVVLDTEGVRANLTAAWLRRLGLEASTLDGGLDALTAIVPVERPRPSELLDLPEISPQELQARMAAGSTRVMDLRSSAAYRAGHVPGSDWSTRAWLDRARSQSVVLVTDDVACARMGAIDLTEAGVLEIHVLGGGLEAWAGAGLPVEESTDVPADEDRIDFVSFTAGRHDGNLDASRQYLAWEVALVDQLDPDERSVFRI